MAAESQEIRNAIIEWYRRIAAGELVAAAEHILSKEQGFLAVGTDEAEWFDSREGLIRAYTEAAKLGRPEIDIRRIHAYREGQVGWAADLVRLKWPGKPPLQMRHTFVLHQEEGQWKVVHAHYSFPALDQA